MVGKGHAGVVEEGGGVGLTREGEGEICGGTEGVRSVLSDDISKGLGNRADGWDRGRGGYTGC